MKSRKIISIFLAASLGISCLAAAPVIHSFDSHVSAAEANNVSRTYFYNQLTDESKKFYDVMKSMYESGKFMNGNESYDMSDGIISQDQIKGYMEGHSDLLNVFSAARDAFYVDYPGIFYVDFSNLSVRVTKDSDGKYHLYIGSDRYDNYYTKGFNSKADVEAAVAEYNNVLNDVVNKAKAVTAKEGESLAAKQIELVHDYLTTNTTYRMDDKCDPDNIGFIRTAYGSLVKHEGVCESYTRAFKAVMDELNIPCVMVQGVYRRTENEVELHIWNYVQIDDVWYAVDVTMDDPINTKLTESNGKDGYENQEYLLVGESTMSIHHVPSETMSSANYKFTYPELALDDYGIERAEYDNGLTVRLKKDSMFEGEPAGEVWVSYNGMGYAEAAKHGYYILFRQYAVDVETNEWVYTDWFYTDPQYYDQTGIQDSPTELHMYMPHIEYMEFAVTDIAPGKTNFGEYEIDDLFYHGDPFLLVASSKLIHNPSGTYKAPPFIKKASPSMTGRLTIGRSYHMVITYDDKLIRDESKQLGLSMECLDFVNRKPIPNSSAIKNSKLENFKWDGESTITFDFTPSEMWEDDSVYYNFVLSGLIGKTSKKAPNNAVYFCSFPCQSCAYFSEGYNWALFAKPSLMENFDIDTTDWQTSDGQALADELADRMVLVATSTNSVQESNMNDALSDIGETPYKTETYNINLTACRKQIVQTGERVRVSLGFPEGYGPEDEGVTFKAYHFKKNDAGQIIGVEEIPCIITKYGLLISCDSFSPFAIAAVKDDTPDKDNEKSVILSNSVGGKISGADSVFTLTEGQSKTISISADDGFVIDTVLAFGKYHNIDNNKSMSLEISYENLTDESNIVDIGFVSEKIKADEEAKKETVVEPMATPANITVASSITTEFGSELVITPTVSEGEHTYQWYKDGQPLTGYNVKDLRIEKVSYSDAGKYKLAVTTFSGATNARTESTVCEVTVLDQSHTHIPAEAVREHEVSASCDTAGSYEEVFYCAECGIELSRETKTIEALGHKFGAWENVSSPNCTDKGSEKRSCTVCGYTETRNIDISGHDWEDHYTIDKEATCTEEGSKSIHCKNCNTVMNSTVIPLADHTPAEAVRESEVSASCDKDGSYDEVVYCAVCGKELSREPKTIEALGHNFGAWETVTPPNCTDKGSEKRSCTVCGYTETRSIDELGHDWESDFTIDKEATCTEEGSKSIHCKNCEAVMSITAIPKTEHVYENGKCIICGIADPSQNQNNNTSVNNSNISDNNSGTPATGDDYTPLIIGFATALISLCVVLINIKRNTKRVK